MKRIGFVTDSTAYLTPEQKRLFDAEVVSLTVNFGDESFPEEGLYSNFQEFYERLKQVSFLPTTSQPSVGDFLEAYKRMAAKVESIISIHITEGISGTVKTARTAAQMLPDLDITVVDSRATAVGEYLVIDAAWRAAEAGMEKKGVLRVIDHVVENLTLLFLPDTLEYLRRGGRIGGAAALLGSLLQIKPILYFNPEKNNIIDLYEKVRTRERGLRRILEELEKAYQSSKRIKTAVVHVGAEEEGKALVERIKLLYPELSPELCAVGPVIGAHIGPGTVGLCFYPLTPELAKFVKY